MYGIAASTRLADITSAIQTRSVKDPLVFLALGTTAVGLLFKISAVPFHMWAPDAYEGAPTPVTAYLAVGSKAACFAFLLRLFLGPLASLRHAWEPMLIAVAVLSMTAGNLAAITQTNIKRLLAYSSISHAGYMLLGLVAGNETGLQGHRRLHSGLHTYEPGRPIGGRCAAPEESRHSSRRRPERSRRPRSPETRLTRR